MGTLTDNLGNVAALCVGGAAVAVAASTGTLGLAPGALETTAAAAGGLIGGVLGRKDRFGPETARVLTAQRKAVLEGYAAFVAAEGDDWALRADLTAADSALAEALKGCVLDRQRLAKAAVSPEGFAEAATAAVMEALGKERPDLFGPEKAKTLPYAFARAVITAGLAAAWQNRRFYDALEPALILEMARGIGVLDERTRRMEAMLADLVARGGTGEARELLEKLATGFEAENPKAGLADLETFLTAKVAEYKGLRERLAALTEADERVQNIVAAAQDAIDRGAFDEADARLADAEAIQQEERTLREVRQQVQIRATRAQTKLLAGDADAALAHFQAAARMLDPFDPDEGARARDTFLQPLRDHGLRFGGAGLAGAATLARETLSHWTEARHASPWARTQVWLGLALQEQGGRTAGPDGAALLAEAVEAYRAALRVYSEAGHPLDWATTQNNLGNALRNQGERTPGPAGAALLAEAVDAYRAALRVYSEADHPLNWAATQNNLGNALSVQGERMPCPDGAALLADAVDAYRAALRVYTEADHPLDWATTQTNLGVAFSNQGGRTPGPAGAALLAEAVDAYHAALRVYSEADHPLDWAMTQTNLGVALSNQGERTAGPDGAALLAEAVDAYRAALRVYTEADHPLDWAGTQNNLATALQNQGGRTPGPAGAALLAEAVDAYRAALRVYDPEHTGYYFEKCFAARDRVAARLRALDGDDEEPV
ncbi:tetratricopeptide repeat protein [Rhodospira trueperi]|uniref:Tetratricopeptide repeat-containing protein n=1 Tax=Rhodospira trueperi TaxID=69960 RepID=A0A1G7A1Y1_9PROT|nr:tetratricopeptide repeat protein [Rhodospira trueperi]SDE08527.1 Tetratricopeptide repeat-containing protein [Rhodospira trueperi]